MGVSRVENYIDQIKDILFQIGLTKNESEVFLYLARSQTPKDAKEIISRLRLHKGDTYRILKSLQSKGIVESTIDRPMTYLAVPIEKVLDLNIKAVKEHLQRLETGKKDIITNFGLKATDYPIAVSEKFLILKRQDIISAKGVQVVLDAKKEVLWLITSYKGLSTEQIIKCSKNLKIRSLANLKLNDVGMLKRFNSITLKLGNNFETRCINLDENVSYRLLIGDDKSAMLIWEPKIGEDMVAFWTNSEVFIRVLRIFFECLWSQSVDINTRIQQLEQRVSKG